MKPAILVTAEGHVFRGSAFGATGHVSGEVSIDNSVAGYVSALESESNAGKIVLFTSSHIGNVGVNAAPSITASGIVVREGSRIASNWQAKGDLPSALVEADVVGIQDIDTRALVQLVVANPLLRIGIFSGESLPGDLELDSDVPIPRALIARMVETIESEEK